MTLRSRRIAVNRYRRRDRIGYGGTYVCPEDIADYAGTVPYQLTCGITPRVAVLGAEAAAPAREARA